MSRAGIRLLDVLICMDGFITDAGFCMYVCVQIVLKIASVSNANVIITHFPVAYIVELSLVVQWHA